MPRFTVIVVNHNGRDYLPACLDSIAAQSLRDFEVVVVDNASTDGSPELLASRRDVTVILNDRNLGFAAANNQAAAQACGDWLALLNPDAVAGPDWLANAAAAIGRHPGAVMFGSTMLRADDPTVLDGAGDCMSAFGVPWRGGHGQPAVAAISEGEVFGPCAAAAIYRRDAFQEVGGFDQAFFCYCEDVDLAYRLRLRGGYGIQLASPDVRHRGSALAGARSAFVRYHGARNLIWCGLKNTPWPLLSLAVAGMAGFVAASAAVGLLRGHAGPVLRGAGAAVLDLPRIMRQRRRIQRERRVSAGAIARALTWSPLALLRRAIDIRPPRR